MKFVSFKYLFREASRSFIRFPMAICTAIFGSFVSIYMIGLGWREVDENQYLYNIIMTCALGLPLFLSITLFSEKSGHSNGTKWIISGVGLICLVAYYFSLPPHPAHTAAYHIIRFSLLNLAFHFLVAFAPFIGKEALNGFWQFNKVLFLRMVTTVIYSGVLYVGLVLAILSVDKLLGVKVDDDVYAQLWMAIIGIFNTWFFMAGIPENFDELESDSDYPVVLQVFTRFILVPLTLVYMIILYAYVGKIGLEWDWPKGWVSNPILWYSVTGILAFLLVFPKRESTEQGWVRMYSKWFFIALVPLVVVLLLAILKRIEQYGITEGRYYVVVLAFWLAAIAIYFIFSKVKNIKVVPISLFFISVFSTIGPLGSFSISENSQVSRLEIMLTNNSILVDGKIHPSEEMVKFEEQKEISSIITYLNNTHGFSGIQPWFEEDLTTLGDTADTLNYRYSYNARPRLVLELMGLDYVDRWQTESDTHFIFGVKSGTIVKLQGYDYLMNIGLMNYHPEYQIPNKDIRFTVNLDNKTGIIEVNLNDGRQTSIGLIEMIKYLSKEYSNTETQLKQDDMSIDANIDSIQFRFLLNTLSGDLVEDSLNIYNIEANLLIKGIASENL